MKILVAIDFFAPGSVVPEAMKFAGLLSAKVWLLHVAQPDPDFVGYSAGPPTLRKEVAHEYHVEHDRLRQEADKFRQAGLEATPILAQGPTADTILREADKLSVDLIVIGSSGHGPVHQLFFESVCQRVLRSATRPVLVLKAQV